MRFAILCCLTLALTACQQSATEEGLAKQNAERAKLIIERDQALKELAQLRKEMAALEASRQDLEIDQRLARRAIEKARLDAQRAHEQIDQASADGGVSVTTREQEQKAKKLFEESYVIKGTNPDRAIKKLNIILGMLPPEHIYHKKAVKLLTRLNAPPDTQKNPAPAEDDSGEVAMSKSLRKQGIDAHKRKEWAKAVEFYKLALAKNPKDYDLYRLIGTAYAQHAKRKKAYEYYQKYVETCPKCMYAPTIQKILADYRELSE